nr:MAG: putative glycoprotein [Ips phenuiviral-like virus]
MNLKACCFLFALTGVLLYRMIVASSDESPGSDPLRVHSSHGFGHAQNANLKSLMILFNQLMKGNLTFHTKDFDLNFKIDGMDYFEKQSPESNLRPGDIPPPVRISVNNPSNTKIHSSGNSSTESGLSEPETLKKLIITAGNDSKISTPTRRANAILTDLKKAVVDEIGKELKMVNCSGPLNCTPEGDLTKVLRKEDDLETDIEKRTAAKIAELETSLGSEIYFTGNFYRKFYLDNVTIVCEYRTLGFIVTNEIKIVCSVYKPTDPLATMAALPLTDSNYLAFAQKPFKPSNFRTKRESGLDSPTRFEVGLGKTLADLIIVDLEGKEVNNQMEKMYELETLLKVSSECSSKLQLKIETAKCVKVVLNYDLLNNCYQRASCTGTDTFNSEGNCVTENFCVKEYLIIDNNFECSTTKEMATLQSSKKELQSFKFNSLNTEICSVILNGIVKKFKDCTMDLNERVEVSFFNFGGTKELIPVNDVYIQKKKNVKNINNYNCSSTCLIELCKGDDAFLRNFKYDLSSPTYCSYDQSRYELILRKEGLDLPINCYFKKTILTSQSKQIISVKPDYSALGLTCFKGSIKILNIPKNTYKIQVKSRKESVFFITSSKEIEEKIPGQILQWQEPLKVVFYNKGTNIRFEKLLNCSFVDGCDLIDCSFCVEHLTNIHCLTTPEWILLILIFSVLAYIVILISLKLKIRMFAITLKLLSKLTTRCKRSQRKLNIRGAKKEEKTMLDDGSELETIRIENGSSAVNNWIERKPKPHSDKTHRKPLSEHRMRKSVFFIVGLCVLVWIPGVRLEILESCTESKNLLISSKTCTGLTEDTCQLNSQAVLTLNSASGASCLLYSDSNFKTRIVLIINHENPEFVCVKKSLYYTFMAKPTGQAYKVCAEREPCYSTACAINKDQSLPELGLKNETLGLTGCVSSCGCAGCGCWSCSSACTYYRCSLTNLDKKTYEVYSCTDFELQLSFRYQLILDGKVIDESVAVIGPDRTYKSQYFSLTLTSYSIQNFLSTNDCFLQDEENVYFRHCNQRDEYMQGRVGEIQCKSILDSAQADPKGCTMSPTLINPKISDQSVNCELNQVELGTPEYGLPLTVGNGVLELNDKKQVSFKPKTNILLNVLIESKNVVIGKLTQTTKCVIESVSLSGCFSCDSGAIIKIKAKGLSSSSSGYVLCPSALSVSPILVSNLMLEIVIKLSFDKDKVDENCVLVCSGGNTSFHLDGKLKYIPTNFIQKSSTVFIGAKSSGDLINFMDIPWIKTTIVYIVASLFILFSCPLLIKVTIFYFRKVKPL